MVNSMEGYLLGDQNLSWWVIGLSVMSTQASAITFISTPGQSYDDGMRFAQFYIGMPIAMVILSAFVLPLYYRLKVYTAYEFLEQRFSLATRQLTAFLFLLQRGMAAGLTIYAPSIILSAILGWSLVWTNIFMAVLVMVYTISGGSKAVSVTQTQQMTIMLLGMGVAAGVVIWYFPIGLSVQDAVGIAGKMNKLNIIDFEFDPTSRYNIWSGLLAGIFLFLAYFGTDQSQVQRYLSGKSLSESRLGLLFNGIFKVPMQFLVLGIGVLVFVFFQFTKPPLHFNPTNITKLQQTEGYQQYQELDQQWTMLHDQKMLAVVNLKDALSTQDESMVRYAQKMVEQKVDEEKALRGMADKVITKYVPAAATEDNDYVFLYFILNYLPKGLIGILMAVIFSAAMSSFSSELNALGTTTVIDFYKRSWVRGRSDSHYLNASKFITLAWGLIILGFAMTFNLFENLIEAVNIIGSIFYGPILGIFVVAFGFPKVKSREVIMSALTAQLLLLFIHFGNVFGYTKVAFLWFNPIGCLTVVLLALFLTVLNGGVGEAASKVGQ